MVMDQFSPVVREWFELTFPEPTKAQAQGWAAIPQGRHSLILAPTGSGKTLAAFLWGIDKVMTSAVDLEINHVDVATTRLLLRSRPTEGEGRVEILFQYVQRMDLPMVFDGLSIEDSTAEDGSASPWAEVLVGFPECRVFRVLSGGRLVGRVVAAACVVGEDDEGASAASMSPMMG